MVVVVHTQPPENLKWFVMMFRIAAKKLRERRGSHGFEIPHDNGGDDKQRG